MTRNNSIIRQHIKNAGAIFEGAFAAEVFADYGIGPNHTLPTLRASRYRGGLSVYDFLRIRTFVKSHPDALNNSRYHDLVRDTIRLSELEGLYGHAQAARCRSINPALVNTNAVNPDVAETDVTRHFNPEKDFESENLTMGPCIVESHGRSHLSLKDPLSNIIREDVESLMEYHPVQTFSSIAVELRCTANDIVKLNANENPYGVPLGLEKAITDRISDASVYPDPGQ